MSAETVRSRPTVGEAASRTKHPILCKTEKGHEVIIARSTDADRPLGLEELASRVTALSLRIDRMEAR